MAVATFIGDGHRSCAYYLQNTVERKDGSLRMEKKSNGRDTKA